MYTREDYLQIKNFIAVKNQPDFTVLNNMTKEYLYATFRNYQENEKELLQLKIRQGQKFSKLFQRTAESEQEQAAYQMGMYSGVVAVMEYLLKNMD